LECFAGLVGELPATSAVGGELRCSARWQGQNGCRSALPFVSTSSASESLGCRVGRVERGDCREDSEGWLAFLAVPRAWALLAFVEVGRVHVGEWRFCGRVARRQMRYHERGHHERGHHERGHPGVGGPCAGFFPAF
jgi:hypothetical protein